MSIEEAIKHCNEVVEQCTVYFQTNDKEVTQIPSQCASDHRQLANWLQELKERRERESRGINLAKPYVTIQVDTHMMHRVIDETIDNMYFECKNCGQKMFPQRKEESK